MLRNGVKVHLTQLLISLQTHPQLEKFVQQHCHIPTIQLNSRHLPSLVPPVPWLNPSAGMYLRQTGESGLPEKLLLEFKLTYFADGKFAKYKFCPQFKSIDDPL